MKATLPGLHHVTAITGDAQQNLDFYTSTLGLRLVKLTVNYDDPSTYHLYYGDYLGQPGTILTFFAPGPISRGRQGSSQVTGTALAVPAGALGFWEKRLQAQEVPFEVETRFGAKVLAFADPDGMRIELVESDDIPAGQAFGPVGTDYAIRALHSVTLSQNQPELSGRHLTDFLGFAAEGTEGARSRFRAGGDESIGRFVDVLKVDDARRPNSGAGIVHHVAFRTPDDAQEQVWLQKLEAEGHHVSPVMDRQYFHSIYFREPGGVLFEIATNNPGFTADESAADLGSRLVLPAHLEPHRKLLEQRLPRFELNAKS